MAYFVSASLFPSPPTPYLGLFVKHRLIALKKILSEKTPVFVACPTPYFPFKHEIFGRYALYAQRPVDISYDDGLHIAYPRHLQIPFTNSYHTGKFVYSAIKNYYNYFVEKHGQPKKLIAEYGFPDAVALYHLWYETKIPYVVTLRGSDVSYFLRHQTTHPQMIVALTCAEKIICVSEALRQQLHEFYNLPLENMVVIGNGVCPKTFRYMQNDIIRSQYNINTPNVISSVGGLIPRKNHELAIKALPFLPYHTLLIAGEGPEEPRLRALGRSLKVSDRIRFIGSLPQESLAKIYSSSDLFLLCSLSEGRPNVVLEALACGTPVLSSEVQGVNELIIKKSYGEIMNMKSIQPSVLARKILDMQEVEYNRDIIQAHAHAFSWERSATLYKDVLEDGLKID